MPNESTTPISPPSSSAPPSQSALQSLAGSLPATATALAALYWIGRPLGLELPGLVVHMVKTGAWQPVAACALAMGMVAAPVPTVALARSLLSRVLPGKKE